VPQYRVHLSISFILHSTYSYLYEMAYVRR